MIRASDGLDYEDLTARLLGQPAQTSRNNWVSHLRSTPGGEEALDRILRLPADADNALCTSTFVDAQARAAGKSILARNKDFLAGKSVHTVLVDELSGTHVTPGRSAAGAGSAPAGQA